MPARTVEIAFVGSTAQLEAALARAGLVAEGAGFKIGDAFDKGTSKAGGALTRLSQQMANWGIPFAGSLEKIGTQLDEATTKSQRLGASMEALGKVALVGGLGAFAVAAYEGVKGATQLQRQMELLHTQAGATQGEVKRMTSAILNLGPSVGTGPQALSEALYHVESTGLRGGKALDVLKTAAEGAKVGNANLTDVTNALNAVVVAGMPGIKTTSEAMGQLNAIVGAGDMTMQDLADAMGTGITAVAKTFGISMTDVGAALATFGDNNIRGAAAATDLRSAIRLLGADSPTAAKHLQDINLTSLQLAQDMRSGGLIKALEDLKQHLIDSGDTASQQAQIITAAFGGKQSTGIMLLLDQLDRLKSKYGDVAKGGQQFGKDWGATQQTLGFQFDQLKATMQALADKLGVVLIPIIQKLGSAVVDVIGWFQKHKTAAEVLAGVIAGVLSVAITAFVVNKISSLVTGIGHAQDAFVKFSNWLLTGSPTIQKNLGAIGDAGTTAGQNVTKGMQATETAVVSAEGTLTTAAAADGAAITDGFAIDTAVTRNTAAAMTGAEGAVVAAEPTLATEGAADGAAVGKGMLSGFARIFTAAALLYIGEQALKGPLQALSRDIYSATGGALGSGYSGPAMTRAQLDAGLKAAHVSKDFWGPMLATVKSQHELISPGSHETPAQQQALAAFLKSHGVPASAIPGILAMGPVGGYQSPYSQSFTGAPPAGTLNAILATIRHQESGGNYAAYNAGGGASGAYQYIQSTWTKMADAAGFSKYAGGPASAAPKNVQDAVAAYNVQQILNQYHSVADVPLDWYYPASIGNSRLMNTVPYPGAGNTQTPAQYQAAWLAYFHQQPGGGAAPIVNARPVGTPGGMVGNTPTGQQGSGFYDWSTQTFVAATSSQQAAIRASWHLQYGNLPYPSGPAQQAAELKKATPSTSAASWMYDPFTKRYADETPGGRTALENRWYRTHPHQAFPSSPAAVKPWTPIPIGTGEQFVAPPNSTMVPQIESSVKVALAHQAADVNRVATAAFNGLANAAKGVYAHWLADQKAETTKGHTMLNNLLTATSSKNLGQLNVDLNRTHTMALGHLVEKLDATHNKGMVALGVKIEKAYQAALMQQAKLVAQNTYNALVQGFQALAAGFTTRAGNLTSLFGAGQAIGLPGQEGVAAQEAPLTGGLTGSALTNVFAGLIPALEAGPLSAAQAATYAGIFGGNGSALGADFGALATGKLTPADTQSMYSAIVSLISQLASLEQTTSQNTQATSQNTQATATNTTATVAAAPGPQVSINITGINPTDAGAIASEVGWEIRTRIPAFA